eukprot:PhF_6_TR24779/c2_g1_i1/m.34040
MQDFVSKVQFIITQFCPNDYGTGHADLVRQATAVLTNDKISIKDRTTIATLFPAALLTPQGIVPLLKDKESGPALAQHLFSSRSGNIPCDHPAVPRREFRDFLTKAMAEPSVASDAVLKANVGYAFLRAFTETYAKDVFTADETKKAAEVFKESLKNALEKYQADTTIFSLDEIDFLMSVPAIDVLKKGALDVSLLVQQMQASVLNGDVAALSAFYVKHKELAAVWGFPPQLLESLTRDIAARNLIQTSTTPIPLNQLHEVLTGAAPKDAEQAASVVMSSKVIRTMLFRDSLCRFDDLHKVITPGVGVTPVKYNTGVADCQKLLSEWKSQVGQVLAAAQRTEG